MCGCSKNRNPLAGTQRHQTMMPRLPAVNPVVTPTVQRPASLLAQQLLQQAPAGKTLTEQDRRIHQLNREALRKSLNR